MTSLPNLYSGLVWDGVTEYADEIIVADVRPFATPP